ncbi:MAG TPA: hypothetical protein VM778_10340 [Gemmatimonadota bacterium]|nr:hypothetical protein [Gemmatimonadota bacterium]
MRTRARRACAALAGPAAALLAGACASPTADEILVLQTANVYGYTEDCGCRYDSTGGLAKRAWVVDSLRQSRGEPVLLVDAGDFSGGETYYGSALGRVQIEAMRMMGYDAYTLGEWDLNHGPSYVRELVETAPEVAWVHTNYEVVGLEDLGHETLVVEKGGRRIGILGLFNPTILLNPGMGDSVRVEEDIVGAARRGVAVLQAEGVDAIVVLSHLSYKGDLALAELVDGIDLIVSGHGGRSLAAPEKAAIGTWVMAPGDLGRFLGVAAMRFEGEPPEVSGMTGDLIVMVPSIPNDAAVDSLVAAYEEEVRRTGPGRRIEGRFFRLPPEAGENTSSEPPDG